MFDVDYNKVLIDLPEMQESENIVSYPLDINVQSAEGSFLIDVNGKKYLDLTSNKECNPLGYSFNLQIENSYLFDSELFYTTDSLELEKLLKSVTGLYKAIFTTSKSESYNICNDLITIYLNSISKKKILISCLSKNRLNYKFKDITTDYIPLNNDIIAKSFLNRTIGAVIIDIAQIGEEINITNTEYLMILRELCDKNDTLLVIDASSLSPLRTFNGLFNFDSDTLKPDILIISNSVTQGIPFGAVIVSDKVKEIPGAGSTIFAYKSALKFINECMRTETFEIIKNNALYLEKSLNELSKRFITVADVISYGMLFTLIVDISAYDFVKEALNKGIIIEALNSRTLKLSPPYNISKEEIDKLMIVFEEILDNLAKFDRL
ncbi:MAG: aminotransferase class III-fold pyridoxal phosphate-dependent enzyme [Candidatus Gastranaerophilales bacterium]|nr:aminotransferase class III-fold pyridoxal phosphate-dependent enzyme [Candidatus Gastranaerophilales bacterium]